MRCYALPLVLAHVLAASLAPEAAAQADAAPQPAAAQADAATPRAFVDSDRAPRTAAARSLQQALKRDQGAKKDGAAAAQRLADLHIAAAEAIAQLPTDSKAQRRAQQCVAAAQAAAERDGADKAVSSLRLGLSDLAADLAFKPVREAELPKDFPDFGAIDEIEVRDYPSYRMVRAPMKRNGSMSSFWMLFNHIKKNDIAMTTPVQIDYEDGAARQQEQSMAFLYGDPAIGEAGMDGKVEVVDVAARTVLTIGARGYERRDRVEAMHQELLAWLAAHAETYLPDGPMRLLNYNSPSVGDDRRCYEVQVPIRRVEPATHEHGAHPAAGQ